MANISNHYHKLNSIPAFFILLICFAGCASVQQPTGGPKDNTPPKILKESPKNLTRNFSAKKVEIEFDEFIKLSNESKEISISPAMEKAPEFKVKKKLLEIIFKDSLEKNTTYTINFGKGIVDYNEGNILKNYSYVFATGNVIDSLEISGNVTNSITNKPEMETTVFILPLKQDSLFGKKRASIFTTTDSAGNFTLRNLREESYKIYALKEQGGDRIYNSSNEAIAFQKQPILLNKNISGIKLVTFNEEPPILRVLERKLLTDGHLLFTFNKELSNPDLKITSPVGIDGRKKIEFNKQGDSVLVWLPEITFDSINVAILNKSISLDTVTLRRNKKDTYTSAITITDNTATTSKIRQKNDFILTLSAPITTADASKITLLEDSIPRPIKLMKDTTSIRRYRITYPWRNKKQYILKVAENAFTSLSGGKNKAFSRSFSLEPEDNYTNLTLDIIVPDTANAYIIQLINQDKPISSQVIRANKKLEFLGIAPGKYGIRVIYDSNKNGKWDPGKVKDQLQPERIWNYEKETILRVNLEGTDIIKIPPLE